MSVTEQTYAAHTHGGVIRHVHNFVPGDGHDHRPTTVPLRADPRYLREFCAWAEGQYLAGTPGHTAVLAVLKGLRSAVYQAKREGRCLLCGGTK